MVYTLENIYEDFDMRSDLEISKKLFRDICSTFNIESINYILEGGKFKLGSNLSTISIIRLSRNNSKPMINWGESNKYKQELLDEGKKLYNHKTGEGHKWYIYYTDEDYCRYYWNKGKCKITNKSVYRFTPTRGYKGNREKLTSLLKTDELAYLKFKKY
tara:strand:- start:20 stop:496 length:477 start_codon:yes stop_codon:yes gene_type:complete